MGKKIVVLGGGIGGVVAASELRKKLGSENEIILIDKSDKHIFQPSFIGVAFGRRTQNQTYKPLGLIRKRGIKFHNEEVRGINVDRKTISTESDVINFDYLIVALGAQLAPDTIQGLSESSQMFYSLDGAEKLSHEIENFKYGKIILFISRLPYKCPAAPYEMSLLLDDKYLSNDTRKDIDISIYTIEPQPMPTAGPDVGKSIKQILEQRNISFNPLMKVLSVDPEKKEVTFEENKKNEFDMLIAIPPHKVPDVIENSALAGEMGWIPVDPKSLRTKFENIYAIGDCNSIKLPGSYKPEIPLMLPKAGVFANAQAKIVADEISAKINNKHPLKQFDGRGSCFLEIGHKKSGYAAGEFFNAPQPKVDMRNPSIIWYISKLLYEKYWLLTKP